MKKQRGITLIALVITIIVMLILVGVTISMAVNGGLFEYAGSAVSETNNALKAEQALAEGGVNIAGEWYNSVDEYLIASGNKEKPVEVISKTENYIGCYADVDGDGDVDGVIYADLAVGNTKEGQWTHPSCSYAIPKETDLTLLKDYYISGRYDGAFNEEGEPKEVLTATGEGKDRFYVMALEDFREEGSLYYWYYSAGDGEGAEIVTAGGFGTGKANTISMIEKWNASAFGTQNGGVEYKDVWGPIQDSAEYDIVEEANDSGKWFVPSMSEWYAFAGELEIAEDCYGSFLLEPNYWSSSQYDATDTRYMELSTECFGSSFNASYNCIRLSVTF